MPNQTINITGGDISTGTLTLSDGGRTVVRTKWRKRKVSWEKEGNMITSFLIVGKTTYNPFEEPIPTEHDTKVKLKVDKCKGEIEWEYSIYWRHKGQDNDEADHIFDPKISINPSGFLPSPQKLLAAVVAIIVALFSWQLFRRKMHRK